MQTTRVNEANVAGATTAHRVVNRYLVAGGILSAIAALLHLGCILFGALWYRFFGAGERMAQMAAAGHWYPAVAALMIAGILSVWSLYAFSGAGVIRRLPLLRWVLCAITGIYLLRGIGFIAIVANFPGNSAMFWIVSSAICLAIGIVHLIGVRKAWSCL